MGNFIKKQIKGRAMKLPMAVLVCALLVVGAGVAYEAVAVDPLVVTPTTGGEAVSIDTTSDGGFGVWTSLSNPIITESSVGDISVGMHTMTLPEGWEFNTSQSVHIGLTSGGVAGLDLHTYIVTPTANTITYVVTAASVNEAETLTFNYIQVRPTNQNVESGNITATAGIIVGVDENTNFGTLTTVAGLVTQVAFATQPGSTVYGSDLDPQPVVKTQDQFGNHSIVGLASSKDVTLALTGTGALTGTQTLDIGTGAGNGTVAFSGLAVDTAGIGNVLTASADGLVGNDSELFDVAPKTVNVTAQTDTKTYDGDVDSDVSPVGDILESGDTWNSQGSQIFSQSNVGADLTLTTSGASINDGNGGANYTIIYVTDETGVINEKELTVTGATVTPKTYDGNTDAVITGATLDEVVSPDIVTLANNTSGTFDNKNVGADKTVTTAMTITGTDAGNYILTQPTLTGDITKRAITVTATTDSKTYNGSIISIVAPVVDDLASVDSIDTPPTQTFDTRDVGIGKTLTASGLEITGGNSNYIVTYITDTTGIINTKLINVTAQTDTKVYDGLVDSDENPIVDSLEPGDTITTNPIQTFDDKNVDIGKTLTASGLVIADGNGGDNYGINYVDDVTGVISIKSITVTANPQTKVYGELDVLHFTYTPNPALIGYDEFTGALSRISGEAIGTYEIQQGGLTAGSNYNITYILDYLTITDATSPETTDNVPAGWQTFDVTVIFDCNDSVGGNSGCSKVYYTTNGSNPTTLSNFVDIANDWQFTMSTDGEYTIKYRGEDISGNLEDVKTADNLLQLDKIAPEIINETPADGDITSDTTPLISVDFVENGSGIDLNSAKIVVNHTDVTTFAIITEDGVEYTPISQLWNGIHDIVVDVDDLAGNSAVQYSWQFGIDQTQTTILTTSDKYSAHADGVSEIKITAQILEEGNPVTSGDVNFVSVIGTLTNITSLDENGNATAILTSTETGSTIVTASYDSPNGVITSQVYLNFNETPKTISVTASPASVPADGVTESIITATISNNGDPIVGGTVNFISNDMSVLSESSAVSDDEGKATVTLTSANVTWGAQVEASYMGSETIYDYTYVEFTEYTAPDTTAPTATQYPADGSKNVAVTVNPYIDFSEAMNEETLVSGKIELREYDNDFVSSVYNITTNSDGTTRLTFIPNSTLDYEEQYYFFIGTGVEDLSGNKFASDSWYFGQKADHEFTVIAEDVPVTSYDIPLNAGWNLISLPLIPNSAVIVDVLADENFLSTTNDNVNIVKYYNSTEATPWSSYDPVHGGSLGTMEDGKGYWIFMNIADTLTVNGTETAEGGDTPTSYELVEGDWNLVGLKSTTEMIAGDYIRDYTDKTLNEKSILWDYKDRDGDGDREYSENPFYENGNMEPGYGYWLLIQ
ncbi:Ig-like domain-containing protein [Candidatus Parcubacteria bacterium]|nr:Ig-like domain-containing protein [Candidatus Parcubacteria bacterium]